MNVSRRLTGEKRLVVYGFTLRYNRRYTLWLFPVVRLFDTLPLT
jgi:hypothetical protein